MVYFANGDYNFKGCTVPLPNYLSSSKSMKNKAPNHLFSKKIPWGHILKMVSAYQKKLIPHCTMAFIFQRKIFSLIRVISSDCYKRLTFFFESVIESSNYIQWLLLQARRVLPPLKNNEKKFSVGLDFSFIFIKIL